MIVGCYVLHLYCDNLQCPHSDSRFGTHTFVNEFEAQTKSATFKKARKEGWRIGRETQLCPDCAKKQEPAT